MKIVKSFSFAFEGLRTAFKKEVNFKAHVFFIIVVIALAVFLRLNPIEWLILAISIALVVILELINTSIEAIVNLVEPNIKDEAKIAKDVSAAAVLISAVVSIMVGLLLFLPKIIALVF